MTTKSGENLLFEKESYLIRGACFELYNKFGGNFKENIIEKALANQLRLYSLKVDTQKKISIEHLGQKVGVYTPDIIVNDSILIELKVKPFLAKRDDRQFWQYLKASDYKLGFLINFGSKKLEIKRRIYDKARNIRANQFVSPKIYPRISASKIPLLKPQNPRQSASINKGFTLVELVLYFAIFAVVATLGVTVFTFSIEGRKTVQRQSETYINTQRALNQIIDRVRVASGINGASSTLNLAMSDAAKNPTILALSSGAITIKEGTSGPVAITPPTILVTSLSFTKIDNPAPATSSVQIKLTAFYNDNGTAAPGTSYSIQTTAMPLK